MSLSKAARSRKMAIAVDACTSNRSKQTVAWAVENYLVPTDAVVLLYVEPTDSLYGADWGSFRSHNVSPQAQTEKTLEARGLHQHLKDDLAQIAQPLINANIPYTLHVVKDCDLKERICLEATRLRADVVILGSRHQQIDADPKDSISHYCAQHCLCQVIVVRHEDEDAPENDVAESTIPICKL